jgi:hypothetical protein
MNDKKMNAINIKTITAFGLLAMSLFLSSCGGEASKDEVVTNEQEFSHQIPAAKKGSAFSSNDIIWSNQTADLKPHWNYAWSLTKSAAFQPDGIEFVPMKWGATPLSDDTLAALAQAYAEGDIKYMLGFNEPDSADQANVSVDDSLPTWDQLFSIGIPMVSPATVDPLGQWMQDFMALRGNDVSYVAMHWYGGSNADAFLAKVDEVSAAYGKPVWITEFAVADWTATTEQENQHSDQDVIDFMKTVLPALDANENVFRYTWFSVKPSATNFHNLASSALFDARDMETGSTTITALGEVYATHTPNGYAGNGKTPPLVDEVEGTLIVNGHFDGNDASVWVGYNRSIQLETPEIPAVDGVQYGRINQNQDGSFVQSIATPLEAGKTYQLSYHARYVDSAVIPATPPFKVQVKINNNFRPVFEPITTTDLQWTLNQHTFTVTETGTYKVIFYHGNGSFPYFYLDSVSLVELP